MGTAFVHIGVSRSATTTLQRNVFEQLGEIHYLGRTGPHRRHPAADGFSFTDTALLGRTLGSIVRGRMCSRDDVQTLRASIEKLKASDASVIYSNEYLCENKYVPFSEIATGINDIFGQSELIVTVRDPQTVLPSAYLWELAQISDTCMPFTKWLDDAIINPRRIGRLAESLEQYQYASMFKQLQAAFDGGITIFKYEDLVAHPSDFAQALGQLIGVDADRIETLLRLPPQNGTRSGAWYCYRRFAHKVRAAFPLFNVSAMPFARKMDAAIEAGLRRLPRRQIAVSDYDRVRIMQFFPYEIASEY